MKTFVQFLVVVCFAIPRLVSASCNQLTPAQVAGEIEAGFGAAQQLLISVQFQEASVSIDPDLPIGTVIATGESPALATDTTFADCTSGGNGGTIAFDYSAATPSTVSGVYNTNIPGIGFRTTYMRASGNNSTMPFVSTIAGAGRDTNFAQLLSGAKFSIELVKTGDIDSFATVVLNTVGSGIANGDGSQVVLITGGSINVKVLPSCAVNASTLNIDFGTFGPADVSTTAGPTQPVDFTVLCTGPTPPASITAVLSGTPDANDASMLQNTGATNLAIRLREVSSSTILKPNDPGSTLVHRPNGNMQSPFGLEATVLRVGTVAPTAGRIQATATITMTIL
ncbi:fimbrial protein [Paraburkholderia sp. MMS20-SJTR3]|uniref:Fimbrial protein n=1 Tax=Paraburkholderia sejongensis TaxID=2886946 RepID=A0ABS8K0J0_9BURK|nr:fimbrial protein [Paraburkholderia sp. MMS20-SJTR3]MCC8395693.1 fimbrial protein [Paraburkholderia sp. MMS20-SJTR3]